ncbi:MAG: hypothetical protein DRP87_12920 [Spirochaetes bacterium]|nr:MAG: hypothetical protein DRP87_12920 [Spirochaetota bacterium]
MKDSAKTIIFAAVLGLVCAFLLSAVSRFTKPYREANEKAEEVKNFLEALEVPVEKDAASEKLFELFNKYITIKELKGYSLYEFIPEGEARPVAVAIPISGAGLWGHINGVIALEPDLETIRGLRFYQQEETPGLYGEIGSQWFQKQFEGKKIVSTSGEPGFRIIKPGSENNPDRIQNAVDGITGATMTSDRVEEILDRFAKNFREVRADYVR